MWTAACPEIRGGIPDWLKLTPVQQCHTPPETRAVNSITSRVVCGSPQLQSNQPQRDFYYFLPVKKEERKESLTPALAFTARRRCVGSEMGPVWVSRQNYAKRVMLKLRLKNSSSGLTCEKGSIAATIIVAAIHCW